MSDTLPLFVYGQLKLRGTGDPVCVMGDLRQRGTDAAAVFGPDAASQSIDAGGCGLVWGQLLSDSDALMRSLDVTERPQYMRVIVEIIQTGEKAWAYEYVGPFFADMAVISDGDFPL